MPYGPCPSCGYAATTEALSVEGFAYCPQCGHVWPVQVSTTVERRGSEHSARVGAPPRVFRDARRDL